ncbi:MAG: 2-hydroxychromene-2-carboxylate isomerase [Candidatus Binataceae bacterium]|nr:2-hydroxychromene-2-carboxylate isomerase [Candidatus Binataceae bacterium]
MATIEFYFDFLSPYSYLANIQIAALREQPGVEIRFHAIDLEAARNAIGNNRPASHLLPKKLHYLKADLSRWSAKYRVPLIFPDNLASYDSQSAARLNRGFIVAARDGAGEQYRKAAFSALWVDSRAPGDATLATVASAAGLKPAELRAAVDSPEVIAAFDRENREAHSRGVFGVPSFIVDDQLFWGNDRIDFVTEYLRDPAVAVHP